MNIKGRFDLDAYKEHQDILSTESLTKRIMEKGKQIWEVPYYYEDLSDDNDTSDD